MQNLTMFQRSFALLMYHHQMGDAGGNWHTWINTSMIQDVLGITIQAHHYKALRQMQELGIIRSKKMYGRMHYSLTDGAFNELTELLWKAHVGGMSRVYGKEERLFPDG